MPVPDPDAEGMDVREWQMEPGDAVAFNYKTLHGARGNNAGTRRRAFSLRLVGDDALYVERPGRTSPPYPGHEMQPGQRLREDWFPYLKGSEAGCSRRGGVGAASLPIARAVRIGQLFFFCPRADKNEYLTKTDMVAFFQLTGC
jgi:hypothetical protein